MNERILALDIGDVRIGVAVSDMTRTIATPVEVIKRVGFGPDVKRISALCQQYETTEILSGLPLNMDGTEGSRAQLCREFAEKLREATGLPVDMWDERRTTVEAHNILSQHNYHGKKRKNTVDAVAASLILEGYLAFKKR